MLEPPPGAARLNIVHEDDELMVVDKPAGLVCHPTKGDVYSSLISRVRLHLGPQVNPHLIHRLDRETSGLVLIAKTDPAARQIRQALESHRIRKFYLAIVHDPPAKPLPESGVIEAPLGRDESSEIAIKDCVRNDGAAARTDFRVLTRFPSRGGNYALVRVQPLTGRKHQIRIHFHHLGHSIVGDKLYGPDPQIYLDFVQGRMTDLKRRRLILPFQALCAAGLTFEWRGDLVRFCTIPESWFREFVGGLIDWEGVVTEG